ncbi:MAG: 3-oxoacyl-ACP reductase family protein [Candidatus Caenarcaniphilales bacterium]|nr:3-oxoacyl-ACP reductase family protein [Candidatus Caenarcaniphilales bacterium]
MSAAIITGGSRGIGRAIALKLAQIGFPVIINYLSREDAAKELVETIQATGGKARHIQADISKPEDHETLLTTARENFGGVSVLVNNAGITRDNLLIRMSEEEWQAVIKTNLQGVIELSEKAITEMKVADKGKIINIASTVGVHGNAGQANYATAKAALISYTRIKARELMPKIQVNAIAPGLVKTDMTAGFDLTKLADTKLGGAAEPTDIAEAVAFLAQASGNYITGQVIEVDGGLFLWSDVQALAY